MWDKKKLLTIDELSRKDIELILETSGILEPHASKGKLQLCRGEILANVFFEPSTRTEKSFQAAMHRLGGDVIMHKDPGSSREKGESKLDTLRVLEQYSDIMAVRDPETYSLQQYAETLALPIINAGDGSNEHPTQALLDLYTVLKEKGSMENLSIVFTGDLKFGRTVHSLIKALRKFPGNRFFGISPETLELPVDLKGGDYEEILFEDMYGIRPDIVYATRIQKERMVSWAGEKFSYEINNDVLRKLPSTARIMHPLPRVNELNPEIDSDPRVIPFKQVKYGMVVRMALLALMLGHEKELPSQGLSN
ncbi:MAG: aspartate carbamoyltransferase [Candidatus Aenigmarchaeota archaeon]|nr:aspartate carbamoyltransferase [Candidatus Aenigmarchaeota archaeon]